MRWIPAGAGETIIAVTTEKPRKVDPRGCGGDAAPVNAPRENKGGSPRVRGRRLRWFVGIEWPGWIPAGAGETRPVFISRPARKVDPRGCGGDVLEDLVGDLAEGGSPRVRGRRTPVFASWGRVGWIPAGAGETRDVRGVRWRRRVDPRGCGGDTRNPPFVLSGTGGSPRVRGRHYAMGAYPPIEGWIPAGAGETRCMEGSQG